MAWMVDLAHTQVAFGIRHLGISLIRGNMRLAKADLSLDEERPEEARLTAWIDVATLDTRDENRDGHLKGPDFFEVERYPNIEFTTTGLSRRGEGKLTLNGNLKIRETTRPIELEGEYSGPVDDPISGKRKIGFELTGVLTQKDWGLVWNVPMPGGNMLADRVTLTIDAQIIEA
jgi:polyisoprenoid-binding protein YceI